MDSLRVSLILDAPRRDVALADLIADHLQAVGFEVATPEPRPLVRLKAGRRRFVVWVLEHEDGDP